MIENSFSPVQVLDFWFPETGHENSVETHGAFWNERMQGGMDARIIAEFAELTLAAAKGELDHWADTPRGRLALLIALDQFPRSLWRDTPAAYGQDIKATRLVLEGIENGDFDELAPWEQAFFLIALGHCEGPDHLERMKLAAELTEKVVAKLPPAISVMGDGFRRQNARVTAILRRFGRHPHQTRCSEGFPPPRKQIISKRGFFLIFPRVRKWIL